MQKLKIHSMCLSASASLRSLNFFRNLLWSFERSLFLLFLRLCLFYLTFIVCLSGCNLGPYDSSSEKIHMDTYIRSPLETEAAEVLHGESQQLLYGVEYPEAWWEFFQSEQLNEIVDRALAANPTITCAEASLRQAWETYRAQAGALLLPQVDLKGYAENYRLADVHAHGAAPFAFPNSFKLYQLSVSASCHLDLFGGSKRQVEALAAKVDNASYQLLSVRLTLAVNVVSAAFQNALLRAQNKILLKEIETQGSKLAIMEGQRSLGGVSELDLIAQRKKWEQAKVLLPQYERDLEQNFHRLAVYLGEFPGCFEVPQFDLEEFYLPQELPLSLPSTLVHRRPDILLAEANLHEAMANVGVATAIFLGRYQ